MTNAELVVALANARSSRRPPGVRRAAAHDGLRDAESAGELLAPLLGQPVRPEDLSALTALHAALVPVVDALLDGSPPPVDALNALAASEPAIFAVEVGADDRLQPAVRPARPSAAGELLLRLVRELGELDPSRLRRCERPECPLVFYDMTRSGTQRWHAESPCGLRERQRRHRARQA